MNESWRHYQARLEQPRPARNWLLVAVLSALAVGAVVLAAYLGAMP